MSDEGDSVLEDSGAKKPIDLSLPQMCENVFQPSSAFKRWNDQSNEAVD
jgi:hypothetical protein